MTAIRRFFSGDAAGAIVLLAAAIAALIVANSPLASTYFATLHHAVGGMSVHHWIDDGAMALFFLLIGLEVKSEFVSGHLSTWGERIMPGAAALAGMAVPAALYVLVNTGTPANLRGWAIPAATDIAFALGILALLGSRVPTSLKVLLTAIAVIDDLLAILVIAVFYTGHIALLPLLGAGVGLGVLVILNLSGVRSLVPYLLIGVGIWYGVLLSGVHATLAGVAVAMTIPLRTGDGQPPLKRLEHALQPWSSFLIVPAFGFANAGIAFGRMVAADVIAPLPIGIMLGLFLGKQIGIFATIRGLVTFRLAEAPRNANWTQVYGMAVLCGIGFTMSLFIGGLAFAGAPHAMDAVKIGVFAGSILSGVAGWLILHRTAQ
ncbi:Na+/H+ antiporter NhaA [Sphingomonas sp. PP-CC-1A-547]|uniref:Na+/H+ antiporter NhaA n=1 Tax=unclassified Sphingomonas TaxID=196159 RepID=UPI000FF81F5D|nr:Na+/H+ antiporter NhaA [Sphingomonas sp. PP-CC-1A-547]RKE44634.1 sodium/proton antiporter (NhaA family) [Sphingomonas sp. PP-CC-1A-547]TCM06297.1 sodium/proton antiporter (NhaA family) [Sphingomonas sp. PP-CC-3G-468]